MGFEYFKALHIIFIVTWFAGLFYVVRLFIYQTEALEKSEPDRSILSKQLAIMTKRLWLIITWPSAIATFFIGWVMLYFYNYSLPNWLWVKLFFVFLLYIYHFLCHILYKQLSRGESSFTSNQLRLWNEVATLILFAIVFLAVLKSLLGTTVGIIGLFALAMILMLGVKVYKKTRLKK